MRQNNNLIMSMITRKRLNRVAKHVRDFFPYKLKNGHESRDRRFILKTNGDLIFNHDNRGKNTTLLRLLSALTFTRNKLFRVLKYSNARGKVIAFSQEEKSVIRAFVKSSELNINNIPCSRIKSLCTD